LKYWRNYLHLVALKLQLPHPDINISWQFQSIINIIDSNQLKSIVINWLILKINKNQSRNVEWLSIFIDFHWLSLISIGNFKPIFFLFLIHLMVWSGLTSFDWRWPSCPLSSKNFKRVLAFFPLFGDQKHFAFLYFKWTEVIPFDYAGYRNLNRHGAVVVFANALNLANAFVGGFYCCTISYWLTIEINKNW